MYTYKDDIQYRRLRLDANNNFTNNHLMLLPSYFSKVYLRHHNNKIINKNMNNI